MNLIVKCYRSNIKMKFIFKLWRL